MEPPARETKPIIPLLASAVALTLFFVNGTFATGVAPHLLNTSSFEQAGMTTLQRSVSLIAGIV